MVRGARFETDGVEIVYDDVRPETGAGEPIVLVHGFASNRANNWQDTGWYETLLGAGRRVIALDNRGHGESEKRHDPAAYDVPTMADDVIALMDHLDVEEADLFGYSMGGRISVDLVQRYPDRINAAVFGGVGSRIIGERGGNPEAIAGALEAADVDDVDNPVGRDFRLFAKSNGADLEALAAVIRAHNANPSGGDLASVDLPILVAAGSEDEIIGDPGELAAAFPDGESAVIDGEDHLSTVPHEEFVAAVTEFLEANGLQANSPASR